MIRNSNHSPKLVVPYKLRTRYLHQIHEGTNHSGVTCMRELLSNYWWEFKSSDKKSYVDSYGWPKLLSKEHARNDPGVYGMQINALLRQVHHRVALANDDTDHKLEASLNRSIYKDPIQDGDKVLLHRPQATIAQSSNLPWIGDFKVIKINDVMSQVQNENGDTACIHRAHIRRLKP